MKFSKENLCLYAVTDRAWTQHQTLYEQVKEALEGGVTLVQLREKELDEESFIQEAKKILELCHQYQVPLIINDNLNVALKCHADGIHLGQDDLSCKEVKEKYGNHLIVGVSCHNVEEAHQANRDGADYLGVGAMFNTKTKQNVQSLTPTILKDVASASTCPIVAIGGINESNMHLLKNTGIAGVALVSAIFASSNIKEKCELLKKQIKEQLVHD